MKLNRQNNSFSEALCSNVLVLDGAMGTMIQKLNLEESHFRGELFQDHHKPLLSNNDILCLTAPDSILDIHFQYLKSGADIIETNTFNANNLSQAEFGTVDYCYEINKKAAVLASKARERYYKIYGKAREKFIAGSIGPSNTSLFLSEDHNFDSFKYAYLPQINGLIDGGVDCLFVETSYDTLNCKAILVAIDEVFSLKNLTLPIVVTATIDNSGNNLIGQNIIDFYNTVSNFSNIIAFGINCSFGIDSMQKHLERLSQISKLPIVIFANAGLPDETGIYTDSPEYMATQIKDFYNTSEFNIIGGCCGTSPEHINAIAEVVKNIVPSIKKESTRQSPKKTIYISEKTNVSGSKYFKELLEAKNYSDALLFAKDQIKSGASMLDLNLDNLLIDSVVALDSILRIFRADEVLSTTEILIDSSNWDMILHALKLLPNKVYVNSISMEKGEEDFLNKAAQLKRYGAIPIVLAADEDGLAKTYTHKINICKRAHNLLLSIGYNPKSIIYDTLVFPIATGIEEHNKYAFDTIKSIKWIKENLSESNTILGISNISFGFRGDNKTRSIINNIFLHLAEEVGLDYAIINPKELYKVSELETSVFESVQSALLNDLSDPTNTLIELTRQISTDFKLIEQSRSKEVSKTIADALVNSDFEFIEKSISHSLKKYNSATEVLEKLLMPAMSEIGSKFNKGQFFLPHVLKSATLFNKAVDLLKPHFTSSEDINHKEKVLLATVRGDVHDIGKNIISSILKCNGYEVLDLGVKVENTKIIETALKEKVDYIAVSGLISPSLKEMECLAKLMEEEGMNIPLIVGGAATSLNHTANRIDPFYSSLVIQVSNPIELIDYLSFYRSDNDFIKKIKNRYSDIRQAESKENKEHNNNISAPVYIGKSPVEPHFTGLKHYLNHDIEEIVANINWKYYYSKWGIKTSNYNKSDLKKDAIELMQFISQHDIIQANAAYGIFKARSGNDIINVLDSENQIHSISAPRQVFRSDGKHLLSLSDYVSKEDHIGLFSVTTGLGLKIYTEYLEIKKKDVYQSLLIKILADCMVESFADLIHKKVISELWFNDVDSDYLKLSIRPAFGYSVLPDHSQKRKVFDILQADKIGMSLTETFAMEPASSICGLIINNESAKYFNVRTQES